jgi:hypothetical protein
MSLRRRDALIASILLTDIFLLSCEPHEVTKDYFGGQGLNPLAVVRNDVEPGALILKQSDKTIFTESIFDYSTGRRPAATTKELTLGRIGRSFEEVRTGPSAQWLKCIGSSEINPADKNHDGFRAGPQKLLRPVQGSRLLAFAMRQSREIAIAPSTEEVAS